MQTIKATLVVALVAFQSLVFAAPTANARHVLHERRDEHSLRVKREALSADFILPMRIGLTQGNLDRGHDMLMEVSDPQSSKYGQYYSVEEIHDIFAPSEESVAAVKAWLHNAGIALHRISQSTNRQWLQFDAETAEAEKLLKTKMHVYEHDETGEMSIGCDEYHIHEDIQPHVDYITPGIKMIELRTRDANVKRNSPAIKGPIKTPYPKDIDIRKTHSNLQYCNRIITPDCYLAMYNISIATTALTGNELGVFEETAEWLDQADMNSFYENVYPRIPNNTFPTILEIDGAMNRDNATTAGEEALLDFQIALPIIYPQKSIMYLTDSDAVPDEIKKVGLFNTFLDAIDGSYCTYTAFGETGNNNTVDPVYPDKDYKGHLQCGVFTPTNVISLSYALAEFKEGTSANYQKRQCNEYMKLGMQGISVVFASGDAGVASNWGCVKTPTHPVFNPNFPASCPYVTAVGATTLTGAATKDAERAVTQFSSGGGFSNNFLQPSYQASAVEAYFNTPQAPTYPYYTNSSFGDGYYNRSGRGYPDVSAVGQNIVNFGYGLPYVAAGTSAATPLFASILNRINEERLAAGKPTVGFVNPVLYANPQAFHDVTVGDNKACGTQGFECAVGWDPVTGLGTPDYEELLRVFMK